MSVGMGVKAGSNSTLFYLENDSDQPIAIQASLAKREMTVDGLESNPKAGDELTLYPSQLIIPPNEKRSIKVTWVGKTLPEKELSYRLIAEQLPIELEKSKKNKARIKVLLRYVAALYIAAEDYSSAISISKVEADEKNISLTVENKGKKHQVLSNLTLNFSGSAADGKKKDITLTAEELKGMSGENVLAESTRTFRFGKLGKFQNVKSTDKVKISFEKE
jgi:fimbrial chaperone protein